MRNIFASDEGIEDQNAHEKQSDLEFLLDSPCRYGEEDEDLLTSSNEEEVLEPKNEESPSILYPYPLCKSQTFQGKQSMAKRGNSSK